MTGSRYFIAAAIVLLLGATAMPVGVAAYVFAETSPEPYAAAVGVWGSLVLIVAVAGPIALTLAGIVALWTRHAAESDSREWTDPRLEEAAAWLSDERQIIDRR